MNKKLLFLFCCLFIVINTYAEKHSILGIVKFNDLSLANNVNNYIVSKSSLCWELAESTSTVKSYISTNTVHILYFYFVINDLKDRDEIEDKVKNFFTNNVDKIVGYNIDIITNNNDTINKPSKVIRNYKK